MECPACDAPNVDGARYCAKCGALLPPPMVSDDDPLIGQVVGGRFRITGLLGEGGMGRVYTGEQQMGTSIRKVAVKTLLAEFSSDPQVQARFMRECGTVSELEHPNTIKFHDFGQTDSGELYIAMEYVDGKALSDVIEEQALAPKRVDKIMKQICGSLHEAHDKGIIHRDLKPENVILTTRAGETDFVKVLDFGIAKRSEASDAAKEQKLTQAGMVLGTPPYMSPEQFTGKELTNRSDIYSLGVMAYEMLTGQLPFKANTPWEWATQHMTAQPFPFEQTGPLADSIPAVMKNAILRSLSKDADQRQATAKQFYAELSGAGAMATGQLNAEPPDGGAVAGGAMAGGAMAGATEAFPSAEAAAAALGDVGKPGATQIGEPLIPPGMNTGPSAAMGAATGPSAAMGAGPGPGGPMGATGTPAGGMGAGGPAPVTATATRGGGSSGPPKALYGAIAGVVVVGIVLALVFGLGGGDKETDPEPIDLGTDSTTAADDTGTGAAADTTDTADTTTTTTTKTTTPSKTKYYPPPTHTQTRTPAKLTPTQYCNAAIAAAMAHKCAAARNYLNNCRGAKLSAARANVNACR